MHVLAIHMKVMSPRPQLSYMWATITGLNSRDQDKTIINKSNKVPILIQDPLVLMIHFILLLPVNIDMGKIFAT